VNSSEPRIIRSKWLTGTVLVLGPDRINEKRNWFHEKMKAMIAEVAMPLRIRGSTISLKLCQREQPSIMAASSSSWGMFSKNDTISQITIGMVMIRWVTVSAV